MKASALLLTLLLALCTCKHLRFTAGDDVIEVGKKFSPDIYDRGVFVKNRFPFEAINGFLGKANMILGIATTVIDMFRTSITNTVKEFKQGKGFDYLKVKSEMDVNIGFRKMGWDVFIDETIKALDVPPKYKDQFVATLEEGDYTEQNQWGDFNIIFHKDSPAVKNELNFINVMVYNYRDGEKDKFDSIVMHGRANFHLKANEYIWTKCKFIAGGIEQSCKDYSTSEPRDLTKVDIAALVYYFQTVTFVDLFRAFGIDISSKIIR